MGVLLVIGMVLYSVGLGHLLRRFSQRSGLVRSLDSEWNCPEPSIAIPDHVPPEWIDAYRAEQGG